MFTDTAVMFNVMMAFFTNFKCISQVFESVQDLRLVGGICPILMYEIFGFMDETASR
jgi:hypothetical protein